MNDTMKAVRIHDFGGPEVLNYEDTPMPTIGPEEILIHVQAVGVNQIDWEVREGYLQELVPHHLPLILGWDVAGLVEQVGEDVGNFKQGDAVHALLDVARDGAYAEFVATRADLVVPTPVGLDPVHAAAVPTAGLTAWQALFEAANLTAGQRILIHAAAGGVGSYAVQLARWIGAYVIAMGSRGNRNFLLDLGADEVLDYDEVRFEDVVRNVDVVLDTIGYEVQDRSWNVLRPLGFLVSTVTVPDEAVMTERGLLGDYVFPRPDTAQLTELDSLIESGDVVPIVETSLPLKEARQAQELSEARHARGRIVLHVP